MLNISLIIHLLIFSNYFQYTVSSLRLYLHSYWFSLFCVFSFVYNAPHKRIFFLVFLALVINKTEKPDLLLAVYHTSVYLKYDKFQISVQPPGLTAELIAYPGENFSDYLGLHQIIIRLLCTKMKIIIDLNLVHKNQILI